MSYRSLITKVEPSRTPHRRLAAQTDLVVRSDESIDGLGLLFIAAPFQAVTMVACVNWVVRSSAIYQSSRLLLSASTDGFVRGLTFRMSRARPGAAARRLHSDVSRHVTRRELQLLAFCLS